MMGTVFLVSSGYPRLTTPAGSFVHANPHVRCRTSRSFAGMSFARAPRMPVRSVFVEEAAARLQMSRRTVYYWIRDGKLRTIRTVGGTQRVLIESIDALARERIAKRPARS
jgi:excisionase family DNA binding protein